MDYNETKCVYDTLGAFAHKNISVIIVHSTVIILTYQKKKYTL